MKSSAVLLLLAGAIGISSAQVQPASLPPHKIHTADLVGVSIYGESDLARTVRVDSDGAIRLPLLERKVKADGLMPEELEKAVAEAFQAEQILVNWDREVRHFWQVVPKEMLERLDVPVTRDVAAKLKA